MTKLLDKPFKAFTFYALLILTISIPVYVLVVDYIWISELDENNWLTLQNTKQKLEAKPLSPTEIEQLNHIWGELQPGVSITRAADNILPNDSIYEVQRPNPLDPEEGNDRFRGLASYLNINGETYRLTIETNVEESDETFVAVATITLFFFILLIVGFIFLNRRISTRAWQPFYKTLHALQQFELTKDRTITLPQTDILEFNELNHSLTALVKNNVDVYEQQKAFIENASHELQTPIAVLKSKLDLLVQQKNQSPELAELIAAMEAPLSRLSRINKNLLVLAKVENKQYNQQQELSLKDQVENALVLFEDYLQSKQLSLTTQLNNSKSVTANAFLLETLVHNLISNAIRYTTAGGEITITLLDNKLICANSGNQALQQSNLFKRFAANTTEQVSSGLGLAIIKEIATKYGWSVNYHFQEKMHTFTVSF